MVVDARQETTEAGLPASEAGSVAVCGVPENADRNDIGLALASQLGTWKHTDETTVLCLHSVTTLLATSDAGRVISLITGLNHLCDRLDVVAHHHVDPDEHDEQTVATLRPLYDAVIEQSPDGGLTDSQREALLVAFETGYFEEPRDATLGEVAADLDVSQPAASGLLRRGIKRLISSSLMHEDERTYRSAATRCSDDDCHLRARLVATSASRIACRDRDVPLM